MDASREPLLAVLRKTCDWLSLPDNDFTYSYWEDFPDALRELDPLIRAIESGGPLPSSGLSILFLPAGPVQEVSLSSGWGNEFVALADRFDAALAQVR